MIKKLSLSVLRIHDFRLLLVIRMFVIMTLQSQAVIVGWQIYSMTKNTFLLGLTGLAEALPALACAIFAGHIVDISHPRKIYTAGIAVLTLNTLGLFLIAGEVLPVSQHALLLYIFSGVFISGIVRSFIMPAVFSLVPIIVSRAEIPAATAWLSASAQTAIVSSPAIAGLVYGGYGARGAWMLPTLLISMAFLTVNFLRTAHSRDREKREPAMHSIRAGWGFILRTPALLSVMALDMFAVLFGGAVAMLPAYADQILHVGSEGLGVLRAAPALGAVITALVLAFHPMKRITAIRLLWVVAGFGVCMIGFGLSTMFWLSILFLVLSGCFDSVSMLIRSTMMQLLTPENMRGRISAINSMFIISSNEIGAFESGTAARFLGLVPSVVMGGVATLLIVAATALLSPKMRRTVVEANKE
ncbi:MAG: MFS transporter [Proteobacteria bacterium]|nr:MFS transporter [Pseudomonadota bacterium]